MSLPNLVVIGAMKCGTTSLHRHLAAHPGAMRQTEAGQHAWRALVRSVGAERAHRLKGGALRAREQVLRAPVARPELTPARRAELRSVLADEVAALRAHTGQAFASWEL